MSVTINKLTSAWAEFSEEQDRITRVLVVDDEPGMLRLMETILEGDEFDVTTAPTGEDALAAFNETQISDLYNVNQVEFIIEEVQVVGDDNGSITQIKVTFNLDPDPTFVDLDNFSLSNGVATVVGNRQVTLAGRVLILLNPAFHAVDGLRFAVTGYSAWAPWTSLAILLLVDLLLATIALRLFAIGYKIKP